MYQICVSGAAKGVSVEDGKHLAEALGVAVAKAGHSLFTGATIGLPNYAAEAYKKAGGAMSLGLSPASSKVEHVLKYRLPTEAYDCIVYTGLDYVGRDLLLIKSCDAVLTLGGRMGTLHEFAIAMETDKPVGVLRGAGGTSMVIEDIMNMANPPRQDNPVLFGDDPEKLVEDILKIVSQDNKKYQHIYKYA